MKNLMGNTDFIDLPLLKKGKVRNVYDAGENLLIVVTDRISAFDVVFDDLIPYKGMVLNQISAFWFNYTADIAENHVVSVDTKEYPDEFKPYGDKLAGRSMLVKKAEMLQAECIVRGYLEGSGLKEYEKTGKVSGVVLPEGLKKCQKLSEPVFTPTTKAEEGHDESVTFDELAGSIGMDMAKKLKDLSIRLYLKASEYAESRGIILADTKLEFGMYKGRLIVGDEMFTPDSSRFWDKKDYFPGRAQKSFDKQYLREYLETLDWDKTPPAPGLPEEVIKNTSGKYIEAYETITGKKFEKGL